MMQEYLLTQFNKTSQVPKQRGIQSLSDDRKQWPAGKRFNENNSIQQQFENCLLG